MGCPASDSSLQAHAFHALWCPVTMQVQTSVQAACEPKQSGRLDSDVEELKLRDCNGREVAHAPWLHEEIPKSCSGRLETSFLGLMDRCTACLGHAAALQQTSSDVELAP